VKTWTCPKCNFKTLAEDSEQYLCPICGSEFTSDGKDITDPGKMHEFEKQKREKQFTRRVASRKRILGIGAFTFTGIVVL